MTNYDQRDLRYRLEDELGVVFVEIPAGAYPVGAPLERSALFQKERRWPASPRIADYIAEPSGASTTWNAKGFWISEDLVRWSHYARIGRKRKGLAGSLRAAIDARSEAASSWGTTQRKRKAFLEKYTSNFVPSHTNGAYASWKSAKKDRLEPDPALELPFADCQALAEALGCRLPGWREWEAAARGREGRLWSWGDDPPDADEMKLTTLEGVLHREDPESTMGMGRDTWTIDWSYRVVDDFGPYADARSPFGLTGLVRWGAEWNDARGSTLGEAHPGLLRSFCDLGEERVSYDWKNASNPTEAYPSHHRAFSGRGLATCGTPASYPNASFRLVLGGSPG